MFVHADIVTQRYVDEWGGVGWGGVGIQIEKDNAWLP